MRGPFEPGIDHPEPYAPRGGSIVGRKRAVWPAVPDRRQNRWLAATACPPSAGWGHSGSYALGYLSQDATTPNVRLSRTTSRARRRAVAHEPKGGGGSPTPIGSVKDRGCPHTRKRTSWIDRVRKRDRLGTSKPDSRQRTVPIPSRLGSSRRTPSCMSVGGFRSPSTRHIRRTQAGHSEGRAD